MKGGWGGGGLYFFRCLIINMLKFLDIVEK